MDHRDKILADEALVSDKGRETFTTMTCLDIKNRAETKWSFMYRFYADEFLNSVRFEFFVSSGMVIKDISLNQDLELLLDPLPQTKYNQCLYRIKGIHLLNVSLFVSFTKKKLG
jgi:hypothetical protein